jgi:hypothetical protein
MFLDGIFTRTTDTRVIVSATTSRSDSGSEASQATSWKLTEFVGNSSIRLSQSSGSEICDSNQGQTQQQQHLERQKGISRVGGRRHASEVGNAPT